MSAKIANFVGIDVSKSKVDLALIKNSDKSSIINGTFENNIKGMKKLLKFLSKEQQLDLSTTLFCMEYTGMYSRCLLNYLSENKYLIWVEMPVQIIKSVGLQRGKSDKIDAQKIALYAYKNVEDAVLWQPKSEILQRIQDLLRLRERLIQSINALQTPINELKVTGNKEASLMLQRSCRASINALEKDLEAVDEKLDELIKQDDNLKKKYDLSVTVPGVGRITAMSLLCFTNAYKIYNEGKQLACYCGVAPFEHSSGTSVRGKTRVSNMANKVLKRYLHMGALSTIRYKGELQEYYNRKVAEGKNKMSVLNAVRNKMILRVAAVIRKGTPYEKYLAYAK